MNRMLSAMIGLVICVVVTGVYLHHRTQQRAAEHVAMLAEQQKNAERYAIEKVQREQAAATARAEQAESNDREQRANQSSQLMQRMSESLQQESRDTQEYIDVLRNFQGISAAWSDTDDADKLRKIADRINAISVPACLQPSKNQLSEQIFSEANGADSDLSKAAFSFFLQEQKRCVRTVWRPAGSV